LVAKEIDLIILIIALNQFFEVAGYLADYLVWMTLQLTIASERKW